MPSNTILLWDIKNNEPAQVPVEQAREALGSGAYREYREGAPSLQGIPQDLGSQRPNNPLERLTLGETPTTDLLEQSQDALAADREEMFGGFRGGLQSFGEGIFDAATLGLVEGQTDLKSQAMREENQGWNALGQAVGTLGTIGVSGSPLGLVNEAGTAFKGGLQAYLGGGKLAAVGAAAAEGALFGAATEATHMAADAIIRDKPFVAEQLSSAATLGAIMGGGLEAMLQGATAIARPKSVKAAEAAVIPKEDAEEFVSAIRDSHTALSATFDQHAINYRLLKTFRDDALEGVPGVANTIEGKALSTLDDDWFAVREEALDAVSEARRNVSRFDPAKILDLDSAGFKSYTKAYGEYEAKVAALDELLRRPPDLRGIAEAEAAAAAAAAAEAEAARLAKLPGTVLEARPLVARMKGRGARADDIPAYEKAVDLLEEEANAVRAQIPPASPANVRSPARQNQIRRAEEMEAEVAALRERLNQVKVEARPLNEPIKGPTPDAPAIDRSAPTLPGAGTKAGTGKAKARSAAVAEVTAPPVPPTTLDNEIRIRIEQDVFRGKPRPENAADWEPYIQAYSKRIDESKRLSAKNGEPLEVQKKALQLEEKVYQALLKEQQTIRTEEKLLLQGTPEQIEAVKRARVAREASLRDDALQNASAQPIGMASAFTPGPNSNTPILRRFLNEWSALPGGPIRPVPGSDDISALSSAMGRIKANADKVFNINPAASGLPGLTSRMGVSELIGKHGYFADALTDAYAAHQYGRLVARLAKNPESKLPPSLLAKYGWEDNLPAAFGARDAAATGRYMTRAGNPGVGGFMGGAVVYNVVAGTLGRMSAWAGEKKMKMAGAVVSLLGGGRGAKAVRASSALRASYTGNEDDATTDVIKRVEQLQQTMANPEAIRQRIRDSVAPVASGSPDLAMHIEEASMRRLENLSRRAPAFISEPGLVPPRPFGAEWDAFQDYEAVTHDPDEVIRAVKTKTLTRAKADASREQHPAQHEHLVNLVLQGLTPEKVRNMSLTQLQQAEFILGYSLQPQLGSAQQAVYARVKEKHNSVAGGAANPRGVEKPTWAQAASAPPPRR